MAGRRSRVYLLDTSVVVHLVRGKELGQYLASTFALKDLIYRPFVSIVSHGELGELVTLDLNDRAILDGYVEVSRASRKAAGGARVLSNSDTWIAAGAKAAEATILTTDKDFVRLNPHCCAVQYVDPAPWT